MKHAMPIEAMRAHAGAVAGKLRALAHPDRLLIMCRLSEGEASVTELVAATGLRQAIVSQHLATLREVGAVASRAEQQLRIYAVVDPAMARLFEALCAACGPEPA